MFAGAFFESDLFDYEKLNPLGRVANLILLLLLILLLHSHFKNNHIGVFKWYTLGVFILLMTAVWQTVSVYTGLIPFPFDTRAHLHSAGGLELNVGARITGIAREPSYFTMYAVDFFVFALLLYTGVKRYLYTFLAVFLLLVSLSPSGYIVFILALLGAYLFSNLKFSSFNLVIKKSSLIILFVGFMVSVIVITVASNLGFLDYFLTRVTDTRSTVTSARSYMAYMPFVWAADSNFFSVLFGHGIKSYSIIGTAFNVPSGEPVHVTSNNIYVDTFWESGFLGLAVLLSFFYWVFIKIMKSPYSKLQIFIALFVLFDLMFSGVFRADFASFRFFILLYLIFILIQYDLRKIKGFYV